MLTMTLKFIILTTFVLIFANNTQAQTLTESLMNCGQVQNSLKRLVCYDDIVNSMKGKDEPEQIMSVPAPIPKKVLPTSSVNSEAAITNNKALTAKPKGEVDSTVKVESTNKAEKPKANNAYFGFEQQQLAELKIEDKISARVVKIDKSAHKNRLFSLNNGQVWRETERAYLKVKVDDTIAIERGVMGSFHLTVENLNQRIKVVRIK